MSQLRAEAARNPSFVYAAILRDAIRRQERVDNLHLSDVLIVLRNSGYTIDRKTGLIDKDAGLSSAAE